MMLSGVTETFISRHSSESIFLEAAGFAYALIVGHGYNLQ